MGKQAQTHIKTEFQPSVTSKSSHLLQRQCGCERSSGLGHRGGSGGQLLTLKQQASERTEAKEAPPILHELLGTPMLKIQPKLKIGGPNDKYEQEADRIADQVMRMPEPQIQRQVDLEEADEDIVQAKLRSAQTPPAIQCKCTQCEEEETIQPKATPLMQRQVESEEEDEETLQTKELPGSTPEVTPNTQTQINTLRNLGKPLPKSLRAFYEPRFGMDFSGIRIHTEPSVNKIASSLNARAFTLGQDIFFSQQEFQPETTSGKQLLAHELTHTIQQVGGHSRLRVRQSRDDAAYVNTNNTTSANDEAAYVNNNTATPANNTTFHPPLSHHPTLLTKPMIMRLSLERFKKRLDYAEKNDENELGQQKRTKQELVINELFNHPTFQNLWDWLGNCKCQRGDHGPIKLRIRRTFSDSAQTFGGFDQKRGILTINPKIRAARDNPLELVDTIVHEVVHAISWARRNRLCPGQALPLQKLDIINPPGEKTLLEKIQSRRDPCKRNRFSTAQEPPKELNLVNVKGKIAELDQFERSGPSASDPCYGFQDIREEPQVKIIQIIDDIQQQTNVGESTRTKVNQILREDLRQARQKADASAEFASLTQRGDQFSWILERAPKLQKFMQCRDKECSKPRRKRDTERCFNEVSE
ncbi:DUF4157 domain-containing protein [Leptothoe sp. LEGE 181152]|nr:DUF4157 domain-containing protein [Leptothoe sp. LEGE 181152]